MAWMLPRLALTLALLSLLGLGGYAVGRWLGAGVLGCLLGAAAGATLAQMVDAWQLGRLMRWLQTADDEAPPQRLGQWSDLGYRVERALRTRDRALANEQRRLSDFLSAIEASPNGVLLLDAGHHISWCNRVAADLLGLNPRRDVGQAVTNLVRAPAFVAHLQGGVWQDAVQFQARGGDTVVLVMVRAYGGGQKLVVAQDITERLRSDAMRRDFVANVSHEIRTPLTVLAGFVETMATLPLGEAERRRVLTLMQQQTDRMRALVADLLTLAQLEGSPRPPTDRWVPLAGLVERVLSDMRSLSKGQHRIALDPSGPSFDLAGTEAELFSAVVNLATNAVRYTPAGGEITLGWQAVEAGGLAVWVRDTGPGIAREHHARLTERFYRVDPSRARETGGTGLGLSIVKHVMQRHGGRLELDSQVGVGSTFRLVFSASRVRETTVSAIGADASA